MPGQASLLGLEGLSRAALVEYLSAADELLALGRAVRDTSGQGPRLPSLAGRTVINLFLEPSTRTRISFELAAKRLGAECVNFTAATSSTVKGETLDDTARNIDAMGTDVVVIRTSHAGGPQAVSRRVRAHVINAGDGAHEHPTQGLLDASTICAHRAGRGLPSGGRAGGQPSSGRVDGYDLGGLRVAIVGDIRHSRVARSDIYALNTLGASVVVTGPRTMIPPGIGELGCDVAPTLEAALEGAQVIIMLRIQLERGAGGFLPSLREYARSFGLTPDKLKLAAPDALVMHPGPINRGVELHPEVADGPQSVILEQVERGVAVRMAVLCKLLGAPIPRAGGAGGAVPAGGRS